MISLDWKERLQKDTLAYIDTKLSQKEYDIEYVYNAYPQRVDNKIPKEVVTLCCKIIAQKTLSKAPEYIEFLDYLWQKNEENAVQAFCVLTARYIKKYPDVFFAYITNILLSCDNEHFANLILDKVIMPVIKNKLSASVDNFISWFKKAKPAVKNSLVKATLKLFKQDESYVGLLQKKFEDGWYTAAKDDIKHYAHILKHAYKFDEQVYLQTYQRYVNTREPNIAEILCNAIACYHVDMETAINNWAKSGNVRLKKAGLHGQKIITREKKKQEKTA